MNYSITPEQTCTDWLQHYMIVAGPAAIVDSFLSAAAGPGVVPWEIDLDSLEEGWFHLLASPELPQKRTLSIAGCRELAQAMRERKSAEHEDTIRRTATVRTRPIDLNMLIPVPSRLLAAGENDPRSIAWMLEHWGVTQPLRHMKGAPGNEITGDGPDLRKQFEFYSANWTPWAAILEIRARWPGLMIDPRPIYSHH